MRIGQLSHYGISLICFTCRKRLKIRQKIVSFDRNSHGCKVRIRHYKCAKKVHMI